MNVRLLIFAAVALAWPFPSRADNLSQNPDYQALLAFLTPYVRTLAKPVYVYNWHEAKKLSELTTKVRDPRNFKYIQDNSTAYWDAQNKYDGGHDKSYGIGLYAGSDPVSFRQYGGSSKKWVLAEIHLPNGFRMIDASQDRVQLPPKNVGLLARLGCPKSWESSPILLTEMLRPENYKGNPQCGAIIRKLFKDDLKIDAFVYPHAQTKFSECDPSQGSRQSTFVITNGDNLRPADVKIYDAKTSDDRPARLRIQSMFNSVNTVDPVIHSSELEADNFLWKDMEGKAMTKELSPWMRKNLFDCDAKAKSPYLLNSDGHPTTNTLTAPIDPIPFEVPTSNETNEPK
jgi:hypothetical protein